MVKKVGGSCFKIVHEKFRARYAEEESSLLTRNMAEIARQHPDLKPSIQKSVVRYFLTLLLRCCPGWAGCLQLFCTCLP